MNFKYYFRKSSFKKDIESANLLLNQIDIYKPKNFLEVGVFQGVTSRNVCEKLNRKWIVSDIGKFSIHVTKKRLIETQRALKKVEMNWRAFEILNIGKYQKFRFL